MDAETRRDGLLPVYASAVLLAGVVLLTLFQGLAGS